MADVLTLSGGTALAQTIGLVVAPLLTRVYTPSDFGLYSLYTSGIAVLIPFASLQYFSTIVLPDSRRDALNLFLLTVSLTFLSSVLLFIVFSATGLPFVDHWPIFETDLIALLLPIGVAAGGVYQACVYLALKEKVFKGIALSKVLNSFSLCSLQLAFGCFGFGAVGLITASVCGAGIGAGVILRDCSSIFKKHDFDLIRYWQLFREYIDFPKYLTAGGFMDMLSIHAVPFLLAARFSSEVVGVYGLAMVVISAPISLFGKSISQVYLERLASSAIDCGKKIFASFFPVTMLLAIGIGVVLGGFGEVLFGLVFGEGWAKAGTIAQVLAPMFVVQFLANVFAPTLIVYRKNRMRALVQGTLLLTTVLSLILAPLIWADFIFVLRAYSISHFFSYGFYLLIIFRTLENEGGRADRVC